MEITLQYLNFKTTGTNMDGLPIYKGMAMYQSDLCRAACTPAEAMAQISPHIEQLKKRLMLKTSEEKYTLDGASNCYGYEFEYSNTTELPPSELCSDIRDNAAFERYYDYVFEYFQNEGCDYGINEIKEDDRELTVITEHGAVYVPYPD